MPKQSKGAACVDAGGVYVSLMPLCERIELIGDMLRDVTEIEVIEFLIIPKSLPVLVAVLEKQYGPLVSYDESEIVLFRDGSRIEILITTQALFDSALRAMREAA